MCTPVQPVASSTDVAVSTQLQAPAPLPTPPIWTPPSSSVTKLEYTRLLTELSFQIFRTDGSRPPSIKRGLQVTWCGKRAAVADYLTYSPFIPLSASLAIPIYALASLSAHDCKGLAPHRFLATSVV